MPGIVSDQELIERCLRNDLQAQKSLYHKFGPKMLTLCLRYSRDKMEAEDIMQEGFIKVFRNLKAFRGEGSLEGWIRSILVRTAIRMLKKQKLHFPEIDNFQKEDPEPNALELLAAKDILKLIRNLPDGYRTVFNLYVIEGYKHKDIAELLSISENTSRSQLLKARKHLQRMMESQIV